MTLSGLSIAAPPGLPATRTTSGWIPIPGTLTYASTDTTGQAATYNTSANLTTLLDLGNRFQANDSVAGVVNGIVVAVTSSTVTINYGNGLLGTHTITAATFSQFNAHGFPNYGASSPIFQNQFASAVGATYVRSAAHLGVPTIGTWYAAGALDPTGPSLTVGVGAWNLEAKVNLFGQIATAGDNFIGELALSQLPVGGYPSTNPPTDAQLAYDVWQTGATAMSFMEGYMYLRKLIVLTSPATYYLACRIRSGGGSLGSNLTLFSPDGSVVITASLAYVMP